MKALFVWGGVAFFGLMIILAASHSTDVETTPNGCPNCGKQGDEDFTYCDSCGSPR